MGKHVQTAQTVDPQGHGPESGHHPPPWRRSPGRKPGPAPAPATWGRQLLALVRVYTKQPGHTADKGKPFTLPLGSTIDDLAREIHRELPEKMKFARIWGNGRFAGQQVHRTEVLHDGDQVEIHE